jgi:hypothetical protein
MRVSAPRAWGSALRASHFLLLRQKKVSKEKATPGYAVGVADSPALLATGGSTPRVLPRDALHRSGRCGTRAYGPQTVLALYPPAAPLLGAPHGDPKGVADQPTSDFFDCCGGPPKKQRNENWPSSTDVSPGPLRGAEQRNLERIEGEHCLRAKPELRSPRSRRVAQGTRLRRAPTQGWPFLWLLSFGHTKESTPASKAETQAHYEAPQKPAPQYPNQEKH